MDSRCRSSRGRDNDVSSDITQQQREKKKLKPSNDGSTCDDVSDVEDSSQQQENVTQQQQQQQQQQRHHNHRPRDGHGQRSQEKDNNKNETKKKQKKNQRHHHHQQQQTQVINVCVVESHQHALEHIHTALKKQRIITNKGNAGGGSSNSGGCGWKMVHFDAHPDLACSSSLPAMSCFVPRQPELWYQNNTNQHESNKNENNTMNNQTYDQSNNNNNDDVDPTKDLYELLDCSSSGIAEWIMPLVVGGNLQTIEWIKPTFSKQLPLGYHSFHVGCTAYDANDNGDNDSSGSETFHDKVGDDKSSSNNISSSNNNNDTTSFSFLDLVPSSRIKVDWNHPYYLDDNSVVVAPTEKLLLSKQLTLQVRELATEEQETRETTMTETVTAATTTTTNAPCPSSSSSSPPPSSTVLTTITIPTPIPWSLDICLDYFTCLNPFVEELEVEDGKLYHALDQVIYQSKCLYHYYAYGGSEDSNYYFEKNNHDNHTTATITTTTTTTTTTIHSKSSSLYQQELFTFRKLVIELLTVCSRCQNCDKRDEQESIINKLLPYYEYCDAVDGPTLLADLCDAVKASSSTTNCDNVVNEGGNVNKCDDRTNDKNGEEVVINKAVTLAIEAVPYWNMPHDRSSLQENRITKSLSQVEHELMSRRQQSSDVTDARSENYPRRPFVITIARSSIDKFTDPNVVEDLQQRVLKMLRKVYCTCSTTTSTTDTPEGKAATTSTTATSMKSVEVGNDNDPAESCQCLKVILDYGPWEGTYEENL